MKLLHITPEPPSLLSGGGIVIKQTLLSLVENNYSVDYIGPEIADESLARLYDRTYYLSPSNNIFLRLFDTLFMNTNRRYRSWLKLCIDFSAYDAIIMDFTKLHYVLKRIGNTPLFVRVHNVEYDYSQNNYHHDRNLFNLVDACFSKPREQLIVDHANHLIALTEKDKNRLCQLYHISSEKITVIPVCIPPKKIYLPSFDNPNQSPHPLRMLITGSLWYGSNFEGILWFIENVYSRLSIPKELCVAGSHPTPEFLDFVKKIPSITIVNTPVDMAPYFYDAELYIAPIFDGAGMKVKVAEAMSYALPVVGTSHAFEGYAIQHGNNSYIADTIDAFEKSILDYYNLDEKQRYDMRLSSLQLFQSHYSLKRSADLFRKLIDPMSV